MGNSLTNPFAALPQTGDDMAGDAAMSVGEFIGENVVTIAQIGAEIALSGPGALVMQGVKPSC